VGGRDVHELRVVRELVDDQAVAVNRNPHDRQAERAEQHPGHAVAGVLHRDHVARLDQDPADQVDRLLDPAGDQNVARTAANRPGDRDVSRDRGPQPGVAGRFRVHACPHGGLPQLVGHQSPPTGEGKGVRIRDPGPEVEPRPVGRQIRRIRNSRPDGSNPLPDRRRIHSDRRVLGGTWLEGGIDEGALARAGLDETISGQAFIGCGDGVARDGQLGCQFAGGRKCLARAQQAGTDQVHDLPVELAGQVPAAIELDPKVHRPQRSRGRG
jgi:hypothetical protein